ncbi:MAG: hypothetical protein LYZ66_05275 [Nitrososphaerales archaeon]|nr:hypothetical protein [Nitrososphaerales archaeon]
MAGRSKLLLPLVVVVVSVSIGSALFISGGGLRMFTTPSSDNAALPSGCRKPAGGFLLVTSREGWNDSLRHSPSLQSPWPVITVTQGQMVNIVVCNVDNQAHGFQVKHYYDSNIAAVAPGQVIAVSFVANQQGTFVIYCSIFCSIHPQMIGALNVIPA